MPVVAKERTWIREMHHQGLQGVDSEAEFGLDALDQDWHQQAEAACKEKKKPRNSEIVELSKQRQQSASHLLQKKEKSGRGSKKQERLR